MNQLAKVFHVCLDGNELTSNHALISTLSHLEQQALQDIVPLLGSPRLELKEISSSGEDPIWSLPITLPDSSSLPSPSAR